MAKFNRAYFLFLGLCFALPSLAFSTSTSQTPAATSSLISNVDSIKEGKELLLGVQMKLPDGWETFWRTPGEVGYGVKFSWEGSQNLKQADVLWPWPTRVKSNDFIANVYEKEVTFPVKIAPQDVNKPISLQLKLDYLLCNPTACVPSQTQLSLTLPPGKAALTPKAMAITQALEKIPKSSNTDTLSIQDVTVVRQDAEAADVRVNVWSKKGFENPQLFVEGPNGLAFQVPQFTKTDSNNGHFVVQLKKNKTDKSRDSLDVLLQNPLQFTLVNHQEAISLVPKVTNTVSSSSADKDDDYFIGSLVLFAILGGLILNLMPCVFPILSIKVLTLHSFKNKHMQGIFYTLGVLCSFLVIALVILSLQSLGNMVGWGFQMQSPAFLIVLIFLFTLISLNLFGFFDIPFSLNTNLRWQKTHELLYAFGTGVLAAVVTTPCSAPFMATAVGVAISQGSWSAILIFLSLGFGFALPYLILCYLPKKWAILPKPGVWMDKLKQFLGFPMLLTVVWLLWVVGFQINFDSVMMLLVSLCFLILFFWTWRNIRSNKIRLVSILLSLGLVVYPLYWIYQEVTEKPVLNEVYEYSPEKLDSLIKQDRKVFVYATAAWCITCKVNEKMAIETQDVQNFFNAEKVAILKADWTNRNHMILDYLQGFKRAGVPLYVFYSKSGAPTVLPQVLTPSTIIKHIKAQ